jgi:predicted small secreted protein
MRKLSGLMVGVLWLLLGCNTVEGIGKDITKAGETIENAATKKK